MTSFPPPPLLIQPGATPIFANPVSGQGQAATLAQRVLPILAAAKIPCCGPFEITAPIPDSILIEAPAVIVIGGDGTLRSVVARLLSLTPQPPPILLLPLGTANLMFHHLHLPWKDAACAESIPAALLRPRWRWTDLATANGQPFLLMAGVGIDASIVHQLHRRRSGPITRAAYLRPVLATMMNYAYPPLSVSVDGQRLFDSAPAVAFVANVPEYGTGFALLPAANSDDGLLDVCVLPCRSVPDVARLFIAALAGELLQAPGVVSSRGRNLRIESPAAVPVQLDGEVAGYTPLEISLSPHRIRFIVGQQ